MLIVSLLKSDIVKIRELPFEERKKLYEKVIELHKIKVGKKQLGKRKIAKILNIPLGVVKHWLYGGRKPKTNKGYNNPMYGKKHKLETKEKLSKMFLGKHHSPETEFQNLFKDKELKEKIIKLSIRALRKRPTSLEKRFMKIAEKYNLPFKYVGDGSVIINSLNPDFIECNGKKLVIEIFGDYWHRVRPKYDIHTEEGRRKRYKEVGFEMLVLWGHELESLKEEEILNKVRTFIQPINSKFIKK